MFGVVILFMYFVIFSLTLLHAHVIYYYFIILFYYYFIIPLYTFIILVLLFTFIYLYSTFIGMGIYEYMAYDLLLYY